MRRRHTRKTDKSLGGQSIQRAIRIPEAQVQAVQAAIEEGIPDIHSVTDAVIDALWLWLYENRRSAQVAEVDGPRSGVHVRPTWSDVDPATLDA